MNPVAETAKIEEPEGIAAALEERTAEQAIE